MVSFAGHKYVLDEKATEQRKNRAPLSEQEIQAMLRKADTIPNEYFRPRAKAIVAFGKIFGKRRSEISSLKISDLKIEGDLLIVTFTLRKKRKRGLFQYMKFLKSQVLKGNLPLSAIENKTQKQLELEWRAWQQTKDGVHIKEVKSTKGVKLSSPYAQFIIQYWKYVKQTYPEAVYVFPAGKSIFGVYTVFNEDHIDGRTLLNVTKFLNPNAWIHLFRDTKGAEVAKACGRTIDGVYKVKDTLDLENESTAYHYIRRYAVHEMQG